MSRLDRITTGIEIKPQRILLYGVECIGKSGFAACMPSPVFIAAENGTSHIDTARVVPTDWDDAIGILSEIYYQNPRSYSTVVIDTVKWMEQLCEQKVCAVNRVDSLEQIDYGRWKQMILDTYVQLMRWLDALYRAGLHVVLIAHAKVAAFKNPEGPNYDRYSVMMNRPELAEEMKQWCDVVAFMNYDTFITETQDGMRKNKQASSLNRRLMHLSRSIAFDAKNRYLMPDRIDLGNTPTGGFAAYMGEFNRWPERREAMSPSA